MLSLEKYQNKKIAIYGMGKSGFSSAKILRKKNIEIFCWDDNKLIRNKIENFNFPIRKFWLFNKNPVDHILLSPGIDINKCSISSYLRKNLRKIITDIDLFFEFNKKPLIISVTGTNGKSTTCKIIEKILNTAGYSSEVVGNIGNPVLLRKKNIKNFIFILESSSYQLEYSKAFRSKHAIILNISPDHLERHKKMKNYINIKSRIFFAQKKTDYSYINSRNKYSKYLKKIFKLKKLKSKLIEINSSSCKIIIKKINSKYFNNIGNIENLAFAYQVAKKFKIKDETIIKALKNFKGLPHRQEVLFSNKFLTCVNDSKATSFESCLQSLSNHKNIYWIVGGLAKLGDSFNLDTVSKNINKAYIIGKNTTFFEKQLKHKLSYTVSHNIRNALQNISEELKKTKNSYSTILLSPAAASFDQFSNFEERGNYFKKLAKIKLQKFI